MTDKNLFRLIYTSRSLLGGASEQTDHEVGHILDASRRNNPQDGVTGALLFSTDGFAQVLEGACDAVQRVFERIQADPRHSGTVILEFAPIAGRQFADWSMAYAGRVDDDRIRFDALTGGGDATAGAEGAETVLGMLRGIVLRAAPALV